MRVFPAMAPGRSPQEEDKDRVYEGVIEDLSSIRSVLVTPGSSLSFDKKVLNSNWLGSGEHLGIAASVNGSIIAGLPGSSVSWPSTFTGHTVVRGLILAPEESTDAAIVTISDGAKVIFSDCIFTRNYSDDTSVVFADIGQGSEAVFLGCSFFSSNNPSVFGVMNGGGTVVRNHAANAATDCQVAYSVNLTTWTNSNVTAAGLLT